MFTAALIICSMTDITNCQGLSSKSIYTSLEVCEAKEVEAQDYFNSQGVVVMAYRCINWGEPV